MLKLINKISILIIFVSAVFSFNIKNPVNYNINFSDSVFSGGDYVTIEIDVKVDPGFLIYASDTLYLNPTYLEWSDSSYFKCIEPMVDSKIPKVKYDQFLQTDVLYHTDQVTFSQRYQLSYNIQSNSIIIDGEFIYKACDDKMCIPYFESFSKNIYIKKISEKVFAEVLTEPIREEVFTEEPAEADEEDGDKSIISKFFIAFLGGLIAIITPCVFPMIPMTVAFFSKRD